MRFFAFGDSFTFGQGLDESVVTPTSPHPESWPYLVGRNFPDCAVINNGTPGASNKLIAWIILNTVFQPDDIVTICWSCTDRSVIIKEFAQPSIQPHLENSSRMLSHNVDHLGSWMVEDDSHVSHETAKAFFGNVFHPVDAVVQQYMTMNYIDLHLKALGIKHVLHLGITNSIEHEQLAAKSNPANRLIFAQMNHEPLVGDIPHWNQVEMPYTMTPSERRFGTCADGHLSQASHVHFAQQIYNHIKNFT
jgi:hypothetical protein